MFYKKSPQLASSSSNKTDFSHSHWRVPWRKHSKAAWEGWSYSIILGYLLQGGPPFKCEPGPRSAALLARLSLADVRALISVCTIATEERALTTVRRGTVVAHPSPGAAKQPEQRQARGTERITKKTTKNKILCSRSQGLNIFHFRMLTNIEIILLMTTYFRVPSLQWKSKCDNQWRNMRYTCT